MDLTCHANLFLRACDFVFFYFSRNCSVFLVFKQNCSFKEEKREVRLHLVSVWSWKGQITVAHLEHLLHFFQRLLSTIHAGPWNSMKQPFWSGSCAASYRLKMKHGGWFLETCRLQSCLPWSAWLSLSVYLWTWNYRHPTVPSRFVHLLHGAYTYSFDCSSTCV